MAVPQSITARILLLCPPLDGVFLHEMVRMIAHFGLTQTLDPEILFAVDPDESFQRVPAKPAVDYLVKPVDIRVGFLEMFDRSLRPNSFRYSKRLDASIDTYRAAEQIQSVELVQCFPDSTKLG